MKPRLAIGAAGRWRDGRATRVSVGAASAAERTLRAAVAEAISRELAVHDIATAELAAALGVTNTSVKRWCAGHQLPSLYRLLTIAIAIRCRVRELIPDVDGGPHASGLDRQATVGHEVAASERAGRP